MTEVNKEMTWEELINQYKNKRVSAVIHDYQKYENIELPNHIFLNKVFELDEDYSEELWRIVNSRVEGEELFVTPLEVFPVSANPYSPEVSFV